MQTICAHCYTRLPHRRQRSACILCSRCEQNWMVGKTSIPGCKPPAWQAMPATAAAQGQAT
jgi:hypothetical protein